MRILSVQGVRVTEERETKHRPVYGLSRHADASDRRIDQPFSVQCSDAAAEREKVESLYKALTDSQAEVGRKSFRQLRFFCGFRREKNQRDSQGARLRHGGVLGRDAGRPGEAQGESEAVASCQYPVCPLLSSSSNLQLPSSFSQLSKIGSRQTGISGCWMRAGYWNWELAPLLLESPLHSAEGPHVQNPARHSQCHRQIRTGRFRPQTRRAWAWNWFPPAARPSCCATPASP